MTPPCSQLLALREGLDSFSLSKAYIYREQQGRAQKTRDRDPAAAHSGPKGGRHQARHKRHLYVPTNGKLKNSASVLNHVTGIGNAAVSLPSGRTNQKNNRSNATARTELIACPVHLPYLSPNCG